MWIHDHLRIQVDSFFLQFISDGGETALSFSKNGRVFGVAFRLAGSTLAGRALYPHVLCKNCSVSLNLDSQGVSWYPGPPGYCPLPMVPSANRSQAPFPPSHKKDCEVCFLWSYLNLLYLPPRKLVKWAVGVFQMIFCISVFHSLSSPGVDDGWHAGFWKEPLGWEPHGQEPREALQCAQHELYPSLHEGEHMTEKNPDIKGLQMICIVTMSVYRYNSHPGFIRFTHLPDFFF